MGYFYSCKLNRTIFFAFASDSRASLRACICSWGTVGGVAGSSAGFAAAAWGAGIPSRCKAGRCHEQRNGGKSSGWRKRAWCDFKKILQLERHAGEKEEGGGRGRERESSNGRQCANENDLTTRERGGGRRIAIEKRVRGTDGEGKSERIKRKLTLWQTSLFLLFHMLSFSS